MIFSFFAIFFVAIVAQGYLSGRFRERLILDDLMVYRIVDFLALSTTAVAYNLGASWWSLPLAVVCANIGGYVFAAAAGFGAKAGGRRVLLVRDRNWQHGELGERRN